MVNYPNMKKNPILTINSTSKKHYTAHRGMSLEEDISLSNEYYLIHNRAVIYKKPTPVQMLTLKQKKQKQRHFHLEISLNIKLIICKESSIMVELLLLLLHLQA